MQTVEVCMCLCVYDPIVQVSKIPSSVKTNEADFIGDR